MVENPLIIPRFSCLVSGVHYKELERYERTVKISPDETSDELLDRAEIVTEYQGVLEFCHSISIDKDFKVFMAQSQGHGISVKYSRSLGDGHTISKDDIISTIVHAYVDSLAERNKKLG